MYDSREKLESYCGEYKWGLFGKKNKAALCVYKQYIDGEGEEYFTQESGKPQLKKRSFKIEVKDIVKISEGDVEGNHCLIIDYLNVETVITNKKETLLLPCLENMEEAKRLILNLRDECAEEQRKKKKLREQQLLEEQKCEEEKQVFFKNCYNFHIVNDNNPYYELHSDRLQFAGIYIDKEKNLNFVKIDGNQQEESNACIPYDKIHYYEKAGNVHYTTDIQGDGSNFGGSITGATVSKTASILGGLLLGPMGMAAGAVCTYKPMKAEMPSSSFHISSEAHKIDDRNVILNYYSDIKQQFMDIELPADIYNFLQTYIPERKYSIVLELEKKNVISIYEKNETRAMQGREVEKIEESNDTEQFENRIKKLKIMYENGILTEEEFVAEKKRILSEL